MLTQVPVMSVRRVKELIAESEEALLCARAVQSRPVGFEDREGAMRRESAGKWADVFSNRLFSLRTVLARLERREAITEVSGQCQYEDCTASATEIAANREWKGDTKVYCSKHAQIVVDDGCPEYKVSCPNCGCSFGV